MARACWIVFQLAVIGLFLVGAAIAAAPGEKPHFGAALLVGIVFAVLFTALLTRIFDLLRRLLGHQRPHDDARPIVPTRSELLHPSHPVRIESEIRKQIALAAQ